ncbi:MAG TPA: hypothetical protein VN645_13275 [Steroidobacteraceae bacterium]|nr:hypothetical protein [Steroidobacteraceae bacterium]
MKCAVVAALLAVTLPAAAVERIRVRAAQLATDDIKVQQLDAQLSIDSASRGTLTVNTGAVQLPASLAAQVEKQAGAIRGIALQCRDVRIRVPDFACPALRATLRTARWPDLSLNARVALNTENLALSARGDGPLIAGVTPQFDVSGTAANWRASLNLPAMQITAWLPLLRPWLALPADITVSGSTTLAVSATGHGSDISTEAQLTLRDGAFQNAAYTWIGEKLALTARIKAQLREPLAFDVQLAGEHGQSLTGPVLLDLDKNPLQFALRGTATTQALRIEALDSRQKDLAQITGTADIALSPFAITTAQIEAKEIRFPAAYASYMQLALATTPFNQLVTRGSATGQLRIASNLPVALAFSVNDLAFSDAAQKLDVSGVNAELHWAIGNADAERASWLNWESARGWGIAGAKSRLDFTTHDRDFRLLQPARLPLFDGALRINTLSVQKLGQPDMSGDFDAVIEPISMAAVAKALDWPEFAGTLSGRIPGVTYRNQELSLQGDVEAQMFDGRVTASNLRVRDPLGDWPKLHADIAARNLDLDLITHTFEFGSITGRLDADVAGLETFGVSPVAFDLSLRTPPKDRSRHRISQRAVENLSMIGGGTGGALQTGLLRFFEQFGYSRLGLGCRLRNDVCQLSGIEPAADGFYIMKGSGIPKLDIVGHNQRVDWLTFTAQVRDALANPQGIKVGGP